MRAQHLRTSGHGRAARANPTPLTAGKRVFASDTPRSLHVFTRLQASSGGQFREICDLGQKTSRCRCESWRPHQALYPTALQSRAKEEVRVLPGAVPQHTAALPAGSGQLGPAGSTRRRLRPREANADANLGVLS